MRRMTEVGAALAATLILIACEDAARPLGPLRSRVSLDVQSSVGTMIAFVQTEARCGVDMSAGCDPDGGWGWSWWWNVATVNADGTNQANVTDPLEGSTGNALSGETRSAAPAWSPDGMRLAFQGGNEIWTKGVGASGTLARLTNHPANDYSPAWSPNGATIAFGSYRDGPAELYLMRAADGANVTRLTNGVGFTGRPDWSPDGLRIAFDCVVEAGNADICAINADGTGLARLTSDPGGDFGADWSAAGRIAFTTNRYGGNSEIAVMNGDGSVVTRLAPGVIGSDPDWSPDGTRIAFTSDRGVSVMQADGSNAVLITTGHLDGWDYNHATQPVWRPVDTPLPQPPPPPAPPPPPPPAPPPPDQPPVANFSYSCARTKCTFDGRASTDDQGIVSYAWKLGNQQGSTATGVVTTFDYRRAGSYAITLTVKDAAGQSNSLTRTIAVAR